MADDGGPLFCVVIGSGMVGSACAASAAALNRGRVALVGPACQPASEPPFSSHDDYSRVVSVLKSNIGGAPGVHDLALESARSIGEYRRLEAETGVHFYHETGYFKAAPGSGTTATEVAENGLLECATRWPFIEVAALAGDAATGTLQAAGAGWIDPRAHVRAVRQRCEARDVQLVNEVAARLERDESSGQWRVVTAAGTELLSPRVALAVGSFVNLSGLLPRGISVDIELWGKALYHGRIAPEDAASLLEQNMPVVSVSSPAGHDGLEGSTNVSYNGAKAGTYVYFFPPCQYADGHWYIKIGHSPFDPLIDDLEGADTAEKLERWMAGTGDDVIRFTAKSEDYYSRTLASVLPSVSFVDGGYITRCVTSRTSHGDPLLGPLRLPHASDEQCGAGLFVCAGCNGTGAKFALEWGRQLAENIAREPTVTLTAN
eukprot:SAG31_NODE_1878_length_7006_cov_19.371652_1_plen_432_part_00